jgi:hypothetical protein
MYVDPHMRTISLCVWGVPVCIFCAIPGRMHTGAYFTQNSFVFVSHKHKSQNTMVFT